MVARLMAAAVTSQSAKPPFKAAGCPGKTNSASAPKPVQQGFPEAALPPHAGSCGEAGSPSVSHLSLCNSTGRSTLTSRHPTIASMALQLVVPQPVFSPYS